MDLKELTDLISIRQYVVNSTALPTIDRKTINELNGIQLLLDRKIIGLLVSAEFKEYIDYKDVATAKQAAAEITNIYSGIENKNSAIHRDIRNHKLGK
jgi:hypothetical protein